jgi:hypothetical protein
MLQLPQAASASSSLVGGEGEGLRGWSALSLPEVDSTVEWGGCLAGWSSHERAPVLTATSRPLSQTTGSDTSGLGVSALLAILPLFPDIIERLRSELQQVQGRGFHGTRLPWIGQRSEG